MHSYSSLSTSQLNPNQKGKWQDSALTIIIFGNLPTCKAQIQFTFALHNLPEYICIIPSMIRGSHLWSNFCQVRASHNDNTKKLTTWQVGINLTYIKDWSLYKMTYLFMVFIIAFNSRWVISRLSSLIGGGNRSTRRKPPMHQKSLANFPTWIRDLSIGETCQSVKQGDTDWARWANDTKW